MKPEKHIRQAQAEIGKTDPSEAELIAEIRGRFDRYIRAGVSKENAIEGLAMEYTATLVKKALAGHPVPAVQS